MLVSQRSLAHQFVRMHAIGECRPLVGLGYLQELGISCPGKGQEFGAHHGACAKQPASQSVGCIRHQPVHAAEVVVAARS